MVGGAQHRCAQGNDCPTKDHPSDDVGEGVRHAEQRKKGDEKNAGHNRHCQRYLHDAAASHAQAYRDHAEQRNTTGEMTRRKSVCELIQAAWIMYAEKKIHAELKLDYRRARPPNHSLEHLHYHEANPDPADYQESRNRRTRPQR